MNIPFVDLKTQYQAISTGVQKRMNEVLENAQFIMGPQVKECEEALQEYTGAKYALTCSNGSDAIYMALMAMGIGQGDEVITTAFSFIATAEMIVLTGATPVYVDIDPETYNMRVDQLESAVTDKTKAIMPVSLYGQPADMDEIHAFAKSKNLLVIEDAAQSFGAKYKDKMSPAISDIGTTSFFPAKPLGCYGDGGAVFTNDEETYKKMFNFRNHGQSERYLHTGMGINGRMDSLQCVVITEKLKRFSWEVEQRNRIANKYTESFSDLDCRTPIVKDDRTSVWAQYTLEVKDRDSFRAKLQEKNVPTAVHYPMTMPDQPAYKENGRVVAADHARQVASTVVSLPMYPDMSEEIQGYIIEAVRGALG